MVMHCMQGGYSSSASHKTETVSCWCRAESDPLSLETRARTNHNLHLEFRQSAEAQIHKTPTLDFIRLKNVLEDKIYCPVDVSSPACFCGLAVGLQRAPLPYLNFVFCVF
ncbi:hypothetical protein GOODEAATRI_029987 [Goodea atripinnis]|uniref:Uncharacterized protein n=1 Tax=Goodea atripinnis TaxID=208336 RepID=A0ABV0MLX2_9TELE